MTEGVALALLRELIARLGSKRAVAKRVGRTRQWLDTVLGGTTAGPVACMRIARAAGRSRIDVLRAEGHDEWADELVEEGLGSAALVSPDDRALLKHLHTLPDDQQQHFRALITSVAHALSTPPAARADDAPPAPPARPARRRHP